MSASREDIYEIAALLADLDRVQNPLPPTSDGGFRIEPASPPPLPPSAPTEGPSPSRAASTSTPRLPPRASQDPRASTSPTTRLAPPPRSATTTATATSRTASPAEPREPGRSVLPRAADTAPSATKRPVFEPIVEASPPPARPADKASPTVATMAPTPAIEPAQPTVPRSQSLAADADSPSPAPRAERSTAQAPRLAAPQPSSLEQIASLPPIHAPRLPRPALSNRLARPPRRDAGRPSRAVAIDATNVPPVEASPDRSGARLADSTLDSQARSSEPSLGPPRLPPPIASRFPPLASPSLAPIAAARALPSTRLPSPTSFRARRDLTPSPIEPRRRAFAPAIAREARSPLTRPRLPPVGPPSPSRSDRTEPSRLRPALPGFEADPELPDETTSIDDPSIEAPSIDAPRPRFRRRVWLPTRGAVDVAPEPFERAEAALRRRFADRVGWRIR